MYTFQIRISRAARPHKNSAMASPDAANGRPAYPGRAMANGSRSWRAGEILNFRGLGAVTKSKMVETFGSTYKDAVLEGEIVNLSIHNKIGVKWMNLKGKPTIFYGTRHKLFRNGQRKTFSRTGASVDSDAPVTSRVSATAIQPPEYSSPSSEEEDSSDEEGESEDNDDLVTVSGKEWTSNSAQDSFDCRPSADIYSEHPKLRLSVGGVSASSMSPIEISCNSSPVCMVSVLPS
mmetsp:Transcript_80683/g.216242  ORF Transcript_80683/g.216242 Transcript_80683/m.216242 type:complete len:234 (+) Transcript_80683:107-808(+)